MATEQEQRDMELLAPYLNKYGVDISQTSEAIAAEREVMSDFATQGLPRGGLQLLGLPADLLNVVAKMSPLSRKVLQERDWLMDPETPLGGEWLAERAGLPRTGDPGEIAGEIATGLLNPATAGKGVMGLASKMHIEKMYDALVKAKKIKGGKLPSGAERKSLTEVLQDAEDQIILARHLKKQKGKPWAVPGRDIKSIEETAEDYIRNARSNLYGEMDQVKDILYNMERTTDELLASGMIPLKGYKAGSPRAQVLEEGKVYFYNRAHARGDLKDLQGFKAQPDMGMDIILGGKDGMADAVLRVTMNPLADVSTNPGYVSSLRSNTPMGGQRLMRRVAKPVLDKLGIEVHMAPGYSRGWKTQRQSVMTQHYADLDKAKKGNPFTERYKKQIDAYKKWLERFESGSQEKLKKWYRSWGFERGGGGMVRRPDYARYEKWEAGQKKIPKKGMGGFIDSPLYLRDY